MKKPKYLSHYLVLKDLLDGIDVRTKNDATTYYTSRIENIKSDLIKRGIKFKENISKASRYSTYKPYILCKNEENILKAKEVLNTFRTNEILYFLDQS